MCIFIDPFVLVVKIMTAVLHTAFIISAITSVEKILILSVRPPISIHISVISLLIRASFVGIFATKRRNILITLLVGGAGISSVVS